MLRPCVLTSQCVYINSFQITSRKMGVKLGSLEVKPTRRLPLVISLFCGFLDVVNQQSGFKPQKVAHGSNCTHHLLNIRHNSSIQRRSSLTRMIEDGRMLIPSTLHVVQSQNLDRCTWCKWICYNIQYNCILNCISYWYESSWIIVYCKPILIKSRYTGPIVLDSGLFWIVFAHRDNMALPGRM